MPRFDSALHKSHRDEVTNFFVIQNFSVCMGGQLLSRVCEVFSKDYRRSVGGLPDLVLWNPAVKTCKVSTRSSGE